MLRGKPPDIRVPRRHRNPRGLWAEFPNIVTPARTTYNASGVFNLHGHLYNGYAQNHRARWHVSSGMACSTEVDWQALEAFLVYDGVCEGMCTEKDLWLVWRRLE